MRRKAHSLCLTGRKTLTVEGAEEVLRFDETAVEVQTPLGKMEIDGEGLTVLRLDTESETLVLEGRVDGIFYSEKQENGKSAHGILRLFR